MWNFEVGFKTALLDDRILLNGATFYSIRDDQQVETSFQQIPNDPASFVFFTDNAAKGRSMGLELETRWFVSGELEVYANLGLLRAEFDEFSTPQVSISGRAQAHAPNYTLAFGGVYRHASGLFARVDVSALDEFYFDVSHDQKSQSYSVSNVRFGYEAEKWTVQLWLRNVFDERYAVRRLLFWQ